MNGYTGRLIRVDLGNRSFRVEEIKDELCRKYLGGRGFGARLLYDEQAPRTDPLGEKNRVYITTGPLAGTRATSCSRWVVTTKSPLTGAYIRSVVGGDFGAWLKFSGFDGLVIEGKAARPTYLKVDSAGCSFHDASDLWGLKTDATQLALRGKHGEGVRVACIGPAGEVLVKFASIISGRRAAGRGGVGAVLGSKNLKAIVVAPASTRDVPIARPGEFKRLLTEVSKNCRESGSFKSFSEFGTTGSTGYMNTIGIYPVRNFRSGTLNGHESLSQEAYAKLRESHAGCFACPIKCGKVHSVPGGRWKSRSEGPDYESIWAFSGPVDVADIEATIAADQLCDDWGLDTISAGNSIGFAFELFERGLIDTSTTGGLTLRYGDAAAMMSLLALIAKREGFGAVLAEGTRAAAKAIGRGAEEYAMQVKGLELPAYEPRAAKAHGLSMATSTIGASHNIGYCMQELFGSTVPRAADRFSERGKGDIVKYNQDGIAAQDSAVICAFTASYGWVNNDRLGKFLAAVTGADDLGEEKDLLEIGDRIYNTERLFNLREGLTRKDDYLPARIIGEPLAGGAAAGQKYDAYDAMLDDYYTARGWDASGKPTDEKLKALGL